MLILTTMTEIGLKMSEVLSPIIFQLLKTEAAIYAYAKTTLDEEKFTSFIDDIEHQHKASVRELWDKFPNLISDEDGSLKAWLDEKKPQ